MNIGLTINKLFQPTFAAERKGEWESEIDSALFFPKALNAYNCLAGLLTYPGF